MSEDGVPLIGSDGLGGIHTVRTTRKKAEETMKQLNDVVERERDNALAVAWDEGAAFFMEHIHGETVDVSEFNPYRED